MSDPSPETICTNCGKPYEKHFHERSDDWVYCFEDTNGDFFTTDPTPEMIQEAEITRLREENERLRKDAERLDWSEERLMRIRQPITDEEFTTRTIEWFDEDGVVHELTAATLRAAIDAAKESQQ